MGQLIVTCDHCGTRYKLDEAKIPGRGARVTCPSCKHVFVVYRKPEGSVELSAQTAPSTPPPPGPSRPSIDEEIDLLDPDGLDFRSVGIASWKVKVKIGLVYDFNDFKTIDKYIREGRVSGSDLLSHDGESWIPIEEIGDLRRHFCEVFVRARRALDEVDDEDDFSDEEPTRIMASPVAQAGRPKSIKPVQTLPPEPTPTLAADDDGGFDLANAIADATADVEGQSTESGNGNAGGRVGPRFVDPFEAKRNAAKASGRSGDPRRAKPSPKGKKKSSSAAASPAGGGSGRLILIGAVTLLLVMGGLYATTLNRPSTANERPVVTAPTPPTPDADAAVNGSSEADAIRDELLRDLQERGEPVEEVEDDPTIDEWGNPIEQELIPIIPEEFRNNSGDDGLNGGTFSAAGKSAAEHAAAGRRSASSGDWRGAARSFKEASQMEPGSAAYLEGLGEALYRSGQGDQARSALERARAMGSSVAVRLLGDLAYDQGDTSNAMTHYQNYLRSNPPDRAQVESRIASIRGG